MTEIINSVDTWPKAIVAAVLIYAVAWVIVEIIRQTTKD